MKFRTQEELEIAAREAAKKDLKGEIEGLRKIAEDNEAFVTEKGGFGKMNADDLEKWRNRNEAATKARELLTSKKEAAIDHAKSRLIIEEFDQPEDALPGGEGKESRLVTASIGDLWAKSELGQAWADKRGQKDIEIEIGSADILKAVMATTAGIAPETTRNGRLITVASRAPRAIDVFTVQYTDQAAVVYLEETTFSNNAAEVAEGAAAAEATLIVEEKSAPVRKIAVNIPVTEEQLADVSGSRAYIDQRLGFMVRRRLSAQLVTGTGVAPNLLGIIPTVGVQTAARGADSKSVALFKAVNKVYTVGDGEADAILMNPDDMTLMRLEVGGDGQFIFGPPSLNIPMTINGVTVVGDVGTTAGTAVTGDFGMYTALVMRQGIIFSVTDSHDDEFPKGILRIKATVRAAKPCYRPAAFFVTTGLNA